MWLAFRDNVRAAGLLAGYWVTSAANWVNGPIDTDFIIAEDETPDDRNALLMTADVIAGEGAPFGIVGGNWVVPGYTKEQSKAQMKPLVDAGVTYLGEVYRVTDNGTPTYMTLAKMQDVAINWLGFPSSRVEPVFGIFGGLDEYDPAYQEWFAASRSPSYWPIEKLITNA
jgi:hypothetical protein